MNLPDANELITRKLKQIIRFSKWVFTPIAIVFLVVIAWHNREVVKQIYSQAQIDILVVAIIGWSLLYWLYPVMLMTLIKPWKTRLSFKNSLHIHINRLPARYIPGGIWHTVARFSDFRKLGLCGRQLTGLLLLENLLALGLALLLGGGILIFFLESMFWWIVALAGALGGALVIAASLITINHYILPNESQIKVLTYIRVLIIMAIYWLLAAGIFVLYIKSLPDIGGNQQVIRLGGVYLFSWGAGYLAFFAPQGIGVFEIISGKLLQGNLELLSATALMAGFRVVILCADILAWTSLRFTYILRKFL